METESEKETRRRAMAAEGALLLLVDRLTMRGTMSIDEGQEILTLLSKSSDLSAARCSNSLHTMALLKKLRGGGDHTPGAGGQSTGHQADV